MATTTSPEFDDILGNFNRIRHDYIPEDPNDKFPKVPIDLLEALEARFPDKAPSLKTPGREIWAAVGNAQVVRFLRDMHERTSSL